MSATAAGLLQTPREGVASGNRAGAGVAPLAIRLPGFPAWGGEQLVYTGRREAERYTALVYTSRSFVNASLVSPGMVAET